MGLQKAGVTEDELAESVRQAFDENKRLLTAEKVATVIIDGSPHEVVTPDNTARQKAVTSIYDLAGLQKPKQESGGPTGPVFHFHLPDYYSREFVEKETLVVDVEGKDS